LKGLRPEPIAQALHWPTERRAQTVKPMSEGRGFLHGGRSKYRGPLMTSGLLRLIGGCTVYRLGRPRISLASAFLAIGTASSFIEGAEI
jgi:hypothetical protein